MRRCGKCGSEVQEAVSFCPQCGNKMTDAGAEQKPAAKRTKPRVRIIALVLTVVVLGGGLATYLKVLLREYHPVIEAQPSVVVPIMYGIEQQIPSQLITARMKDGQIVIPLKAVMDFKLVRFFDPEEIQPIPILSYITPEGKVVTSMSKSEHCQSTDFYLKGHNIHCASCPSYWNMSSLEAYACCQKYYPDPIPSTLVGEEIRIDISAVRNWKSRL
jgi:hypothetical protein